MQTPPNFTPETPVKPPPLKGAEYIRSFAKNLTESAGVYRMLDAQEKVLYVGKAKNLKKRVTTYGTKGALPTRTLTMISHTVAMEVITTDSEAEALLLEASLIKKLKPVYNILLTDDKSFPFIEVTDHAFPQIRKHRGKQKKGAHYFGPFASVNALNQTLDILQKAFLLRPCNDSIFKNRTRPCLQYQIKRCSAPCVDTINSDDYGALVQQAKDFFTGKSRRIQESISTEMQAESDAMNYEKAALCRDRIRALTQVQHEQSIANNLGDCDVIGLHQNQGRCCVQIFFFRGGQPYGNRAIFPRGSAERDPSDILTATVSQFYQTHIPPKHLLLSHELHDHAMIEEALSLRSPHNVYLTTPKRGDKHTAVQHAVTNAENALSLYLVERTHVATQLASLAKLFALSVSPQRIEVYDNSHISGTNAVGAMIVAGPDGFDKKSYRRFNFPKDSVIDGDDYGMMRQVMERRLTRLQKEDPERTLGMWPDLILIDGGLGQVNAVREVIENLGITKLTYVGISKGPDRNAGREQFFLPGQEPFTLPPTDPVLYYMQQIRDEAHHFAISSHRAKRAKSLTKSSLDSIDGIGSTRKRALLHHFGSASAVEQATLEALQQVDGISQQIANKIHQHFHANG